MALIRYQIKGQEVWPFPFPVLWGVHSSSGDGPSSFTIDYFSTDSLSGPQELLCLCLFLPCPLYVHYDQKWRERKNKIFLHLEETAQIKSSF